jgi:hypothetical protein
MRHTKSLTVGTALLAAAYAGARWPVMATWGATPEEVAARMPGDELVGEAKYRTTHAVTVDAPAEELWRWLVQIGQGRGGMYSYDWLENLLGLQMHSARAIDPALQDLELGDRIRMVPEGTTPDLAFTVTRIEPPLLLVLGPDGTRADAMAAGLPYPAWTFLLRPLDQARTRLLVRFQSDFAPTVAGWLMNKYALAPVHFLMERRMLLRLKERAEAGAQRAG